MIDDATHRALVAWAFWARGKNYLPKDVRAGSAESSYLPRRGNTDMTATEALQESVGSSRALGDHIAGKIDDCVMGLPDKPKAAVRLHYIMWQRMPKEQKFKILGCTEAQYWLHVEYAAEKVRIMLSYLERR